jgi:hypothetical protein
LWIGGKGGTWGCSPALLGSRPEVEFTVVSLPETSRFLSNAIHCPIFHRIYLPPMFFLCLSFLLQQLTMGKVVLFTFFFPWMCLVFKAYSVPPGNKISCGKMGPQLTVCTKHCIIKHIIKCKQWNKTRQKNILSYVFKNQYKKQSKTTARHKTLRFFMNSAV